MKLTPVVTLFQDSFLTYKTLLWRLLLIEVVPLVALFAVGLLSLAASFLVSPGVVVAIVILGVILTVIFGICSNIAMILEVAEPSKKFSLQASYEATRPYFVSFFFVGLLVAIFVALGFVLFIIPAVVVGVWLVFSYFTLVIENKRGVEALKASKEYVRGLWFPVFGRVLILILAVIFVSIGASIFTHSAFGEGVVAAVLENIVSLFVSPFAFVYTYQLYCDVKRVKHQQHEEPTPILA